MAEQIQVTTEELLLKKENWTFILGQITEEMLKLEEIVAGLQGCFDTEAVFVFQKQYGKRQECMKEALQGVLEQVEKLGQIAEVYKETERSNTV